MQAIWRSAVQRESVGEAIAGGFEVVLVTAIATGLVAALQSSAPPAGLAAIYLLAVLEVGDPPRAAGRARGRGAELS